MGSSGLFDADLSGHMNINVAADQEQSLCSEPTSVESFAVGEEGELKEKGAQKIRSTNNAGHLETEWEGGERKKKKRDGKT